MSPKQTHPPVAAVRPHAITQHGETRVDNYFWLREKDNPAVREYLEAENAWTAEQMRDTEPLQEQLYREIVGRIQETDASAPVRIGGWLYYSRTVEGAQYRIFCRKRAESGSVPAEADASGSLAPGTGALAADTPVVERDGEEILLDANQAAEGVAYLQLGVFEPSPDHTLLAYSIDTVGDEDFTVFFKDLRTGKLLPDRIENSYYSLEWAADNRTVFYNILDEARRPYKVLRHALGTDIASDVEVYHETDERFEVDVNRTRDRAYLLLEIHSHTTSETRVLPASEPAGEFRPIVERVQGVEMDVTHHEGRWYIRTSDGAPNFRLVSAPVGNPAKENWREEIPARANATIEAVDALSDFLVVSERFDALPRIRIREFRTGDEHFVQLPDPVYTVEAEAGGEYATPLLRLTYSSLTTPETAYDYGMSGRTLAVVKRDAVLGGFDRENYATERIEATSADGTTIPLSLLYRKGLKRDGSHPALLYGYGSYGISIDASFSQVRLSLVDRGFVYAIAHIRGGGDLGKSWHDAGRMVNKTNTFQDFVAAAEALIRAGYTNSKRLGVMGGSAGGLLIGAVLNLRPDLFGAAIAKVPFVDILSTMSDATLPLTIGEYEEWGNPEQLDHHRRIRAYSPYDNVRVADYPQLLVTAGLNDPRVSYWEPAKWVAKLRAVNPNAYVLLKTNLGAGHFGASGRYERYKETAFDYAFLLEALGDAVGE
jgi:oligopeptidase B